MLTSDIDYVDLGYREIQTIWEVTMGNVYSKHPAVVERRLRDTCLLVPVMASFDELDSLYSLNETAQFIWHKACDGLDEQAIALQLSETFDVPMEEARADAQSVISELCEMQLLTHRV